MVGAMANPPPASTLHPFRMAIAAILLLVFAGTTGFYALSQYGEIYNADTQTAQPLTLLEAFYLCIVTLTSTGYGDLHPHKDAGKTFATLLLVVGFVTLAWAGASALAYIVEGHLSRAVRMRRMMKSIETLKDHYIICGLGRVGMEVVRGLRDEKIDYVIIDRSPELLESTMRDDEFYIIGDATQDEVLVQANINSAKGLIACFPSDADNVFTVLTAKVLNPRLFIIARGLTESSQNKLARAGADRVVLPAQLGGGRMAAMALRPAVVEFLDQSMHTLDGQEPLLLEEIPISEGCKLNGVAIKDSHIKSRSGVNIMGIKDENGRMRINPPSDFVIREGQILVGLGFHSQFQTLRKLIDLPPAEDRLA